MTKMPPEGAIQQLQPTSISPSSVDNIPEADRQAIQKGMEGYYGCSRPHNISSVQQVKEIECGLS